jgi:hypothetical protein
LPKSSEVMVGGNIADAALQIVGELYNDGVQKQFFLINFFSYLTMHLAPTASRVFKASFHLVLCFYTREKKKKKNLFIYSKICHFCIWFRSSQLLHS